MALIKQAGRTIMEKTVLRDHLEVNTFSIFDAWIFLAQQAKAHPEIVKCVLDIQREGDHYLIRMVVFNERGESINVSGSEVVGKVMKAYNLHCSVHDYMRGKQRGVLFVSQMLSDMISNDLESYDD